MIVNKEAAALRHAVDAIVFDMDGVVLDITESIRAVNVLAVPFYLREILGWQASDQLLSSQDIEMFKHAGGFNDDWDLTYAIVLHYVIKQHENPETDMDTLNVIGEPLARYARKLGEKGGGLARAEAFCLDKYPWREREIIERNYRKPVIRRCFQEMYAGDLCQRIYGFEAEYYMGRGYAYNDRNLLDITKVPPGRKIGIHTGRTNEEAEIGKEFAGMTELVPPEFCVTKQDGFHKPDPGGLEMLAKKLGVVSGGIYIGDTLDDLRTVRALNALSTVPPFLIALVLTGPAGAANEALFRRNGADIVASDVNEVLDWLKAS